MENWRLIIGQIEGKYTDKLPCQDNKQLNLNTTQSKRQDWFYPYGLSFSTDYGFIN